MTANFQYKLPDSINQLSQYKYERLNELLHLLNNIQQVTGVLLGGSLSYKEDATKSDIDLFCLVKDVALFEMNLNSNLSVLNDIDTIVLQGTFPWTEKLYTIYFKQDIDFSIDLCLISYDKAEIFFWEPDGYILFDKLNCIDKNRRLQMSNPHYTKQPFLKPNPFSLAVIALKKIEKNISRGHFWNAMEQLNICRRYTMQIIRLNVVKHSNFLGRVDRDIEDAIPYEINSRLSDTAAIYDATDIAHKTVLLIEILESLNETLEKSNETNFQDWILKQLQNEKVKLSNHLNNAQG